MAGKDAGRRVLEGVRKVAYHTDRWRFTPFCNALDACLQFLGQGEQYDYLMCTSGAMFRMNWRAKAWDGGNSDILGMAAETLEPMRGAFRSAGYQMLPVVKAEPSNWAEDLLADSARRTGGELTDETGLRGRIVESIDAGKPVIAFGVIGPPEACVITGYDEGGDVLIGWNVFQDEEKAPAEPSGQFRVRDWYGKTRGLLLFGDKVGKPDPGELDIETLKWALQVLRTPRVRDCDAGPAAFEAWAADMLNDEYFPEGEIDVLRARLMCHWDSMTVTATRGGGSATAYLLAAGEREPLMAEHLRAAAECLDHEDVVHGVAPGQEAHMLRLADPEVRRKVADSILHARDMHMQAADHIEQALLAAGVAPADIPKPEHSKAPTGTRRERGILEGVPKVGFGVIEGNVAMTPFPACLKACLEYMGDDLGFARGEKYPRDAVYAYLMGTTGAAFRLLWKPGWHGDNVASFAIYDDPSEIFRRGFAAAGYEQIPSGHVPPDAKVERFRKMVVESIRDRGRPVIAHGVIGPPEEAIIAGYGEDGRVVYGWSFFQERAIAAAGVEFEPNGYFRKRNWEADTWSLMAIGDKTATPDRRETYIKALQNALRIMRTPIRGDSHNGIAAYDAWAEHILKDDEIAAGSKPDDAFIVHCDAADVVAEGRHFASVFVTQAAEHLPEAKEPLVAAAKCFKAEHDLVWKIWGEVGSNVPSDKTRTEFMKPEVRRRIAPLIRQARDQDAQAAEEIAKALSALGVEVPAAPAPAKTAPAPDAKAPTMLEGLKFPKWSITQLGCMHACLEYLGRDVSRAWLYGGTAHAFFINIHDDVDVEAVTAWDHTFVRNLAPNLGFAVEGVKAVKPEVGEAAFRTAQREAWQFVRRSILLKHPCYGWELKAPYGDFWLITGFDETGYYYAGWETGGPTPWRKLGDQFIPVLEVRSVKLREPASAEAVVRDALLAALRHSTPGWDSSADSDAHFGPDAFDAWARALESGAALHNHHAYNAGAWHECREMAVEFLVEAKAKLPGRADGAFDEAIARYTTVRDKLAAVKGLTPIDHKLGWDEEPKLRSPEAAALVREAGRAEREGLKALSKIAQALGGEAP
jgi:hypothetical protein